MYTLGIDIGSTTSKAVILKDGSEIVASSIDGSYRRNRRSQQGAGKCNERKRSYAGRYGMYRGNRIRTPGPMTGQIIRSVS